LLFDDNLQLSGVINWEFSMIEPILLVGTTPPWASGLVMNNAPTEPWLLHATYVNALKKYEKKFREKRQQPIFDIQPLLDILIYSPRVRLGEFFGNRCPTVTVDTLWQCVIQPTFGQVDRTTLLNIYRNAPGLLEEFKRTRVYIEAKAVFLLSVAS
jgi:hypothetical protein